jgi:hypothetical protein
LLRAAVQSDDSALEALSAIPINRAAMVSAEDIDSDASDTELEDRSKHVQKPKQRTLATRPLVRAVVSVVDASEWLVLDVGSRVR